MAAAGLVDAVGCVVAYLTPVVSVSVSGFRRGDPPGRAVIVRDTGGSVVSPGHAEHQVTVTVWGSAPDDETVTFSVAADVARLLLDAEAQQVGGAACSSVTLLSLPYADPDPVTGRARYSFSARLVLRRN